MCGITAFFGFNDSRIKAAKALFVIKNRGLDDVSILSGVPKERSEKLSPLTKKQKNSKELKFNTIKSTPENPPVSTALKTSVSDENKFSFNSHRVDSSTFFSLGHCLHAIVGTVSQPLINQEADSQLVANCEIYNWQDLNQKYGFGAENDAQLLHAFLDKFHQEPDFVNKCLLELDGVFAFVYKQADRVIVARDIVGVKPIHYLHSGDGLAIASEKKALTSLGFVDIHELNPRVVLIYDQKTNNLQEVNRNYFSIVPEHQGTKEQVQTRTHFLLDQAIKKRIPNKKVALLFSGGIDSTFIAHELKRQGVDFTCYTAAINDPNSPVEPEDLVWAKKVAKELDLKLNIKQINIDQIPTILKHLVPLIEDSNVVKVSVALTFYLASMAAKEDGCRVIFSGLGSEEIFAGYQRHKDSQNINKECLAGLRKIYERDLYRDDVLTMDNILELRVPFLDHQLIDYALKIPESMKLVNLETGETRTKDILRKIAFNKGIPKDIAMRKKRAAQYGSRTQQALKKLSKLGGFKTISEYLHQFYPESNLRLAVLFSGGKDSTRAAQIMKDQNYQLSCLIYLKSKNDYSYMFQSAGSEVINLQADAMQIPLITKETEGEKEAELEDLKTAIQSAKDTYQIEGVVCGALFSNYQRDRIERICEELNLKMFAPLWHKSQQQHMSEVISSGTRAIITAVAADGLNEGWLGKEINSSLLVDLQKLNKKVGLNIAGEGGEFESLVLDSPLFQKEVVLKETGIQMDSSCSGKLLIKNAMLKSKE